MAGSLTGSNATQAYTGVTNNLSSPVRNDWIQLPQSATSVNRKLGGGSTFGLPTLIGSGTKVFTGYSAEGPTQTWTDGTPAASGSQQVGVYVDPSTFAVGQGWQQTVAADTNKRVLEIYWYAYSCASKIVATLSDGSAAALTLTAAQIGAGNEQFYKATITYWANSAGQTLTLQCTATAFATNYGQVGLLAGAYVTTINPTGTLSQTLGDASITSSGSVQGGASGTMAQTLGNAVMAANGEQTYSGSLSQTLGAATGGWPATEEFRSSPPNWSLQNFGSVSISATLKFSGTLSQTLGNVSMTGTAGQPVNASMGVTLGNYTANLQGNVATMATMGVTLGDAAMTANGGQTISGTMSQALGNAATAVPAQETFSGALVRTLQDAYSAVNAAQTFAATWQNFTLASATLNATGTAFLPSGVMAVTLDPAVLNIQGQSIEPSNDFEMGYWVVGHRRQHEL